jgi:hypothetical protein
MFYSLKNGELYSQPQATEGQIPENAIEVFVEGDRPESGGELRLMLTESGYHFRGSKIVTEWVAFSPDPAPNDLTGFFWALQSSPEYQSIASVAYLSPQLLQSLDTARFLFLAPDVFASTIEWGLQALIETIKLTADTHDLDVDEIIATINQLADQYQVAVALN